MDWKIGNTEIKGNVELMNQCELARSIVFSESHFSRQSPAEQTVCWYAVHVKSRHEFVVLDELTEKNLEAFLPAAKRVSQWKDRKKIVKYPLFPGYLFVKISPGPEAFLDVLRTRGVVTFISLEPGKPTPVAPEEIDSLRLLVESGKELDVYPHLKQGTRIRIKNGPLKNAEGILIRKENEYLFQVTVELLGRSVSIRVAAQEVESLC